MVEKLKSKRYKTKNFIRCIKKEIEKSFKFKRLFKGVNMKVIVVHSGDAWMEGEADVLCVCTEEVARKCYGYPNDNETYIFEEFKVKDTYTEDEVLIESEEQDV